MKSKTFVMMFVAIGCGLVAAYLTARISARQATPDTVPVLVAKDKIHAGQVIKEPEKLFVEMRYPGGSTPNAISSFDDLKNKMVSKSVQPGQWLTPDDLSSNFGIELPKGYYAMSVKVDAVSGASGFILPKSRVNVVATVRPNGVTGKPKVLTVLQDVLVLAVDTMATRPDDKMAVSQLNTALLAVKPADSQKLALAQSMGELRLVLRAHDDESKVPLPPQEQLEVDQTGFGGEGGTGTPAVKVAVAKRDLEAGRVIEDPDKLFQVKSVTEVPDKAVPAEELGSLRGKTLRHALFKDGVLTGKHFEGGEPVAVAVAKAPEVKVHKLFIQNGGAAPSVTTYTMDGLATVESDAAPQPPAEAEPTGAKPAGTEPAAGAKPVGKAPKAQ
jgi:pilus assembly protein CpaB